MRHPISVEFDYGWHEVKVTFGLRGTAGWGRSREMAKISVNLHRVMSFGGFVEGMFNIGLWPGPGAPEFIAEGVEERIFQRYLNRASS